MKKQQTKLSLNKKTVSVLQANEMAAIKGGKTFTPITQDSDSFVACGSCFGDCPTNSTVCDNNPFTLPMTFQQA